VTNIIVEYNTDEDAKTLINVLKENQESDRIKYSITIIKKQEPNEIVTTPTGEKVKLTQAEYAYYQNLSSTKRRKAVYEKVFFKAHGTFKGSRPHPSSPYQTASPFYSNGILGAQTFPGNTSAKQLHEMLTRSLNDRDNKGRLGDWRLTHAKKYGGIWSFRYEKFVRVAFKGETRNVIIQSDFQESE